MQRNPPRALQKRGGPWAEGGPAQGRRSCGTGLVRADRFPGKGSGGLPEKGANDDAG